MPNIQEIESAILLLSKDDLTNFRDWFDKFDAKLWDKQFENDVKSGKLDNLANRAISDFQSGKCKEL
ncbi:MAG: hypothetical protein J7L86_01255 [Candidatus Marinimicrobia bacterium]|nr:hypothetical protein [Candidatus Neomarinimicrobiota bacterium]